MPKEPEFKLTIMYGYKFLEKEFVWIGRKTIRGFFNRYEYFVSTPYLTIRCFELDEAYQLKFRIQHV